MNLTSAGSIAAPTLTPFLRNADAFLAFPGASCVLPLRTTASAMRHSAPALYMSTPRKQPAGASPVEEEQWKAKPMDDWMVYATKASERTEEDWLRIEAERRLVQPEVPVRCLTRIH